VHTRRALDGPLFERGRYGVRATALGEPVPERADPGDPGGTWSAGSVYRAGGTVAYGGAARRCLRGHQAQPGREPPNTPALWQLTCVPEPPGHLGRACPSARPAPPRLLPDGTEARSHTAPRRCVRGA
jgi:hypothetical protein